MKFEEIVAFRERHGITQVELANLLNLPNPRRGGQVTVARWESGQRAPAPYLPLALREVERRLLAESRERRTKRKTDPS